MHPGGRILLNIAAALIALGGFYDIFAPRLPSNLSAACEGNPAAGKIARELLRALGGALIAVGAAVAVLVNSSAMRDKRLTLGLVFLLVLPSEGINAFSMYRVGSPFYVPLAFILLALIGVMLA